MYCYEFCKYKNHCDVQLDILALKKLYTVKIWLILALHVWCTVSALGYLFKMKLSVEDDSDVLKNCSIGAVKSEVIAQYKIEKYFINQIMVCVVNAVLIISTVGLNGISVLTIQKSPSLKEKVCYFLILIQSSIDLTVGLVGLPLHLYFVISELLGVAKCLLNLLTVQILLYLNASSLAVLSAMTFERYYGVLHPILHRTRVTKRRMLIFILCVMVFMLLSIVLWFTYLSLFVFLVYAALVFLLLYTGYAYTRIFMVARKKLGHSGNRPGIVEPNQTTANKRSFLKELKLAKSCFLVLICYMIFFIPGPVVYFVNANSDTQSIRRIKRSWVVSLFAVNSSLNSLIFFWAKSMLRKEATKILKRICCPHNSS